MEATIYAKMCIRDRIRTWQELYRIVMEPDELENLGSKNRKHQFEQLERTEQ